jgi:hypothetical protein
MKNQEYAIVDIETTGGNAQPNYRNWLSIHDG